MYQESLYPKTKQVLNHLKNRNFLNRFYLAGGTALAIQTGHRKSIDLDFFTSEFPKHSFLLQNLSELKPSTIQEAPGTIDILINDVKVSFLEYKYPLLEDFAEFEGIKLASILDILCMKLTAISSRGSKKDFYDLYFGLKHLDFPKIWSGFEKKYQEVNYQKLHILKSLVYFEDAEAEPEPDLLTKVSWQEVKDSITRSVLQAI